MRFTVLWGLVWLSALLATTSSKGAVDISQVATGIYRGRPVQSRADLQVLRQYGIRTVVDLRNFRRFAIGREQRRLTAMGIAYYQVPIRFPLQDNTPDQALALITNPRLQPVLVHCNLGNDRVGLVIALYRVRNQGWSKAAAFAEMERFGFHHYLVGLERYLWNSPVSPQPVVPAPNQLPTPGMQQNVARRPGEPVRATRRVFLSPRWR